MNQNASMLKLRSCLFLTGVMLFGALAPPAQQLPRALTTDPSPDQEFPAAIEAPDVMSHGARLNAVFYIASGRGPHPTVLLMHGFPGNEKNLDLAYAIRRAGWNVLIPHYRGS
jgi:predicted alpha/beta-fold hydrolase